MLYWHKQAEKYRHEAWLYRRDAGGQWHGTTYGESVLEITALAFSLGDLLEGEGERVILLGDNSPHWVMGNFAILAAGAITVPAYTTYTAADYRHLLQDSGAVMAIVENAHMAERLLQSGNHNLQKIILMEEADNWQEFKQQHSELKCYLWRELITDSKQKNWHDLPGTQKQSDKTATIIYTSGTTAHALGVELSHKSLLANMRACHEVVQKIPFIGQEVFLSFLPLSHAYEYMCGQFLTAAMGARVYFTSVESLRRDLQEVQPTLMTAVPRLYDAFYGSIRVMLQSASPLRRWLFEKTYELGKRQYLQPQKFHLHHRLANALLGGLVRRKIKKFLGCRLKAFVSGGAALNPEVALFFTALDVLILQGYGLTEASPVVSVNLPRRDRKPDDIYGVGRPLNGVQVKIADDGEILIKGDLVMNGYWNNPEKTAATIKGGWLHSGDVGYCDSAGRLHITDRKKDIIVTKGGDNIAPAKIESLLALQEAVLQAVVYVNPKGRLHALIVADKKATHEAIDAAIKSVNQQLSAAEKIHGWVAADEEFTIENGLLTPSMKCKRRKILQHYELL